MSRAGSSSPPLLGFRRSRANTNDWSPAYASSESAESYAWDNADVADYTAASATAHLNLRVGESTASDEEVFNSPDQSVVYRSTPINSDASTPVSRQSPPPPPPVDPLHVPLNTDSPPLPTSDGRQSGLSADTVVTMAAADETSRKKRHFEAVFEAMDVWADDFDGWDPETVAEPNRSSMLDDAARARDALRAALSYFEAYPCREWTDARRQEVNAVKKKLAALVKNGRSAGPPRPTSNPVSVQSSCSEIRQERAANREPFITRRAENLLDTLDAIISTIPQGNQELREIDQRLITATEQRRQICGDIEKVAEDAVAGGNVTTVTNLDRVREQIWLRFDVAQQHVVHQKKSRGYLPRDTLNYNQRVDLKLPKFTGDFGDATDFYTFKAKFDEYAEMIGMHNNIEKAAKLRYDCLSGAAKEITVHLNGFDEMMQQLETTFGRPTILFANRTSELARLGRCPTDVIKRRSWVINVRAKLLALKELAVKHGMMYEFDASAVLAEVQRNLLTQDLHALRKRIREKNTRGIMPGKERLDCILNFLVELEEWATSDIDFEMHVRRPGELLAGLKLTDKPTKPEVRPAKKIFFATTTPDEDGESDDSADQSSTSSKPSTDLNGATFVSMSAQPKAMNCALCNKTHTHLLYCEKYQKARVKQRWPLVCKTGACLRCLRMDAGFPADTKLREEWFSAHKPYCKTDLLCMLDRCEEREESRKNHITLCIFHTSQNRDRQQEIVDSLDPHLIKPNTKFFFAAMPVVLPPDADKSKLSPPPSIVSTRGAVPTVVEPDIDDVPIYLLQYIESDINKGERLLVFYDSGCYGAGLSDRACSLLETQTTRMGPTSIEVAGGGVVTLPHGDERFWLPLADGPPRVATITALRMGEVSSPFPVWPLQEAWRTLNDAYQCQHPGAELPLVEDQIGGSSVDVMLGIRYHKYFPKLLFHLPSGLAIYRSALKSWNGRNGVLGGPHPAWAQALKMSSLMTPRVYLSSEMRAFRAHAAVLYNQLPELSCTMLRRPVCLPDVGDLDSHSPVCDCCGETSETDCNTKMFSVNHDVKEHKLMDEIGSELEYRCVKCRNCNDCRRGEVLERVSLVEEREQALIESCVTLNAADRMLISSLPFTTDPVSALKGNKRIAMKILETQLRLIARSPEMKADVERSHGKLVDRGHVVEVSSLPSHIQQDVLDGGYFIPWRTVYNANSLSTPCRLVFDASSRTPQGESLNNVLAKGQNKLAKLYHLLLQFRFGSAAFTADVSMAYNALKLPTHHYKYQKYLWSKGLEAGCTVVVMVVVTLIYGVRPAGNLTMAGFDLVADYALENRPELKLGAEALKSRAYMDDVFAAYWNTKLRDRAAVGLEDTLHIGGMAVKAITKSGVAPSERVSADGKQVGLVGYVWEPEIDTIGFDIKPLFLGKAKRGKLPELVTGDVKAALHGQFTKRIVAGKVAGVFDPLGLLTPITARLKLDLSVISKLDWDDRIPEDYLDTWVDNLNDIQQLKNIKLPRNVVHPDAVAPSFELLVCCDASETIAVATVYVRCELRGGGYSCQLLTAKSRLVNLCTVPRAELQAAKMGATLGHVVGEIMGAAVCNVVYVTDSAITLFWINQDQRPLQVGVRNAVIEIRRLSDPANWWHVESSLNPADIGTRRATINDVQPDAEWWSGKAWMQLNRDAMPLRGLDDLVLSNVEKQQACAEIRSHDVQGIVLSNMNTKVGQRTAFASYLIDPCSRPWLKFIHLYTLVARCARIWLHKARKLKVQGKKVFVGELTEQDRAETEAAIFRATTREVRRFNDWSKVATLGELRDGVLYFTGRVLDGQQVDNIANVMLDLTPLSFVKPVTDRFSPISYAVMIHCHVVVTHHGGAVSTLRASRSLIYCLKGRELAREVRDACAHCRRYKARMVQAEMGKFHESRLTVAPAFYLVQVDLFGPLSAHCEHNHRASVKVWGLVFKCPATLAVAVHCMQAYNTQAFVQAYTRFSSRYGHPAKLYIDEGSQLMKACRDMEYGLVDVANTLNAKYQVGVEFSSCPVGGHNMHGIVERSIREIKRVFEAVYMGLRLDILSYETAFSWTANELNSLPICLGSRYENLDSTDLITPARLILGRNNTRALAGCPTVTGPGHLMQQMEDVVKAWWTAWRDEKLLDFIPRPAGWNKSDPIVAIGDIVVFMKDGDNLLSTSVWRLGRICKANAGRDGIVRQVEIEYKIPGEAVFRTTKRSVRKVAVLCHENEVDFVGQLNKATAAADCVYFAH